MKCILWFLLVATLPFGSILADAPKSKDARICMGLSVSSGFHCMRP
jgi:hypothetical protein